MYLAPYEAEFFANYTQYRVMKYLWCAVSPIVALVGTYGNIMVLVVLGRQTRSVSTYVYLVALAVGDEVVLILTVLRNWLHHVFGLDIQCLHVVVCRLSFFLVSSASHFSVWLIVAVTMERVLVVARPLQATAYVSVRRACIIVYCLTAFSLLISSHFLLTLSIKQTNLTDVDFFQVYHYCEMNALYEPIMRIPWAWIDACLYGYVPFVCIIVANTVIIYCLNRATRRRRELTRAQEIPMIPRGDSASQKARLTYSNSSAQCSPLPPRPHRRPASQNRGVQRTIMLLVVSFVFLLTTMPILVVKTIFVYMQTTNKTWQSNATHASMSFVDALANILMLVNHSINFFLYCIAGAKFRKDLMRRCPLLCRKRHAENRESNMSISNLRQNNAKTDFSVYDHSVT